MFKNTFVTTLLSFLLFFSMDFKAQESDLKLEWPLEITSKKGHVTTLYQPQLESLKSNILEGRMAVTIKPTDKDIIFGALWFKARLSTDTEKRTVVLEEMDIVKTHFPEMVDEEKQTKFSGLLKAEIESWNLVMSLDMILASLNETEQQLELADQIKNDAPVVYYRNSPSILMVIDGEPILKTDDESKVEYVVNTPFFIVKDPKAEQYYIKGGDFWYTSNTILGAWSETKKVPNKIEKFAISNNTDVEPDSAMLSYTESPEIIVESKSAELILVNGETDYKAIKGTNLLYVENSENDIIMDINSQEHYVLLAGRWYSSKSLNDGDWKFCEPDALPQDFSKIPEDSEMASVRVSVPNTSEAQTALLEQSIPQTATIDRKEAKVEVSYDGNPTFEKVEGTDVSYAINTDKTVLLIHNKYYCVDNAVWFVSNKATGPWEVSVVRPDEVDQIPPEAPVYNVKYTYIYDSTPDVVYVGYLPGYTYSYVYGGVVVYGTGYYYHPWYGAYYYPRPVTWGYGVHYNPWTGWGFTFGVSYGYMGWGFHPHSHCYWGPRGYYGGYRHGYHHGYNRGYHNGYHNGYRAGYKAGQRNAHRNVYNNRSSGVRKTGTVRNSPANSVNNKARPANKPNNMYTDKKGNVYERNQNGSFENRSNKPSTQPATRDRSTTTQQRPATTVQPSTRQQQPRQNQNYQQQLNRSYQNRSQGSQNYNRSQQMQRSGGSHPMNGGGGGRRR